MNENNPDKLEGIPKPLSPEETEAYEALRKRQEATDANELLNDKEKQKTPDFRPDYFKEELADKTDRIIRPQAPAVQLEEQHYEAGIPLKNDPKTEKEKLDALNRMMNSNESGNDQTEALKKLLE